MSASAVIAFFGLRYEITLDEFEDPADSRTQAALRVGLKYYSSNFGGLDERYLLFIGARLAILGLENESERCLSIEELKSVIELTSTKLRDAGFVERPKLYLQWEQDV